MKLFILKFSETIIWKNILFSTLLLTINSAFGQSTKCLETKGYIYDKEGNLAYDATKTYNTQGLLTSVKESFIKSGLGDYLKEKQYTYDSKGNIQTVSEFINNEFQNKRTRLYNSQNQLISETIVTAQNATPVLVYSLANGVAQIFDVQGNPSSSEEVKLDKDGNLLKQTTFNTDGQPMMMLEKTYTTAGKIATQLRTDVLANMVFKTTYTYNTSGLLTEETTSVNNELNSKITYEYNAAGQLTKKVTYNRANLEEYAINYVYNANGLLTSESFSVKNELISNKTFTYDGTGNKTQQNENERGKLVRYVKWEYACQ